MATICTDGFRLGHAVDEASLGRGDENGEATGVLSIRSTRSSLIVLASLIAAGSVAKSRSSTARILFRISITGSGTCSPP
jgi:hypothetical protein